MSGTAILSPGRAEPQIEQAANKKRCQSSDESLHRAQSWLGLEGKRRKIADDDQQFTNIQWLTTLGRWVYLVGALKQPSRDTIVIQGRPYLNAGSTSLPPNRYPDRVQ